jgi:hypothetical protein
MMQWQIPQNNGAEEIDEHDMPTEPIAYEAVSPSSPTASQGATSSYNEAIPVPQPLEQPFPRQYVPVMPSQMAPPQAAGIGVYPVSPPPPVQGQKKGKLSPGGVIGSGIGQPPVDARSVRATQRRSSSVPALVKLFFIAVRILLLMQLVLEILHWPDNALWVSIVYVLSPVFIWPVRMLIQQISLPFSLWPEIYTLLAIVFYSLFSRILVRFLKAIKHYQ